MSLKLHRWLHRRGFSRKRLKGGRLHRWLGDTLFNKDLWSLKKEPVARAWLLGCLITSSPLMGAHLILSCFLAIPVRANIPITFSLQWLTNPFTAPVYYPAAFVLGCRVLRFEPDEFRGWRKTLAYLMEMNFHSIRSEITELSKIVAALLVGGLIIGLVVGVTGYVLIMMFWPEEKNPEAES